MASVVILGAGLTGISAAYHFEREGFFDYVMFEKDATPGGLCRSVVQDGFTFDYTGHLLHLSDPAIRHMILTIAGEELFQHITRVSSIYSHETYTNYPYQVNLHGLPHEVIVECIEAFVNRQQGDVDFSSFIDWVMKNFGAGFAKHFFFPYQQKIFDVPIEELSATWTGRFVPTTSLRALLYGALGTTDTTIGYNAEFLYPRSGGTFAWVEKLIHTLCLPILTGYEVIGIDMQQQIVRCANGHVEPYQQLISTLPLDRLLALIKEPPTVHIKQAMNHLRCNSVISFNLGIKRPELVPAHWVYYPETQFPFYRIGFPSQLTNTMAPAGCSSLAGECAILQRTPESAQARTQACLQAVRSLFDINEHEIATELIITVPHAYVIFDRWRDLHLPALLTRLAEHQVHSIGRYGAWKYASMQDAIIDGKNIVTQLLHPPYPTQPQRSTPSQAAQV